MTLLNLPLYLLLTLSVAFSIGFTAFAFRARRSMPGGFWVSLIGLSVTIWSGGYLVELLVSGFEAKLLWANLKQIGNVLLPLAFLLFSLRYSHLTDRIRKRMFFLLLIEPVVVQVLYWMDPQLHMMRQFPRMVNLINLRLLAFEFGPGLYWHFAYSALLTIIGAAIMISRFLRSKGVYRTQIGYILLGMSIPFLGAFATMLGWLPSQFDTTPLLLGFSFPVMAIGLFRYQFFKMIPVDNQVILDHLPFGLVVLDLSSQERIIALNPAAREIIQADSETALGRPLHDFITDWSFDPRDSETSCDFELTWHERIYAVTCARITGPDEPLELWLTLFRDLTEQRKLQASLSASEEKYRSLVENSMDGIGIAQDGKIQYCNPQLAALIGYDMDEVIGQPYRRFITDEMDALQKLRASSRSAGNEPDTLYEARLIHRDGHVIPVEISTATVTYNENEAFLVIVRDISARKHAEEQRERTLALVTATIESSPNGILVIDAHQNVLAHNQRLLEMWDLPDNWAQIPASEDRLNMMLRKVEDRAVMYQHAHELLKDLTRDDLIRMRLNDGQVFERLSQPFYVQEKLVGRLYMYTDITERIQAEEQLRNNEEKYRLLAENASDVIWTISLDGRFTYVSPAVEQLRGYTVEEVMQQTLDEALTVESRKIVGDAIQDIYKALAAGKDLLEINNRYILEQPCKDGTTVWTEVETSLMQNDEGEIVGIQGVSRDITERRQYEKELEVARQLAEERSTEAQDALLREQQLHAVTRTISSSMEIDTILSELLRQTVEITHADEARLGLVSEDGSQLHFKHGMDRETSFMLDMDIPRDANYFSWAVIDQRGGMRFNSREEIEANGYYTDILEELGVCSILAVPVMAGLSVLGVLVAFNKTEGNPFSDHDLVMMESIGTQAGIAIQNARLFEEVNLLAITDPLTRLYNRRYFFNMAHLELERSRRYGSDLAFIMLDLDDFKKVNDTYGHLAGDEVLSSVAECIRKNLRQVDLAARYGGEEMVIMLPETDLDSALVLAERLRKTVADSLVMVGKHSISVTISVGVSSLNSQSGIVVSRLLDQADQALYAAKAKGKNQVVAWPDVPPK